MCLHYPYSRILDIKVPETYKGKYPSLIFKKSAYSLALVQILSILRRDIFTSLIQSSRRPELDQSKLERFPIY
jgi:hypothetical protein